MAALEPVQFDNEMELPVYGDGASELDAEGEQDIELDYSLAPTPAAGNTDGGDLSTVDAHDVDEGEDEEEDEEEEDDGEDEVEEDEEDFVGAVKIPHGHGVESDDDAIVEDASDANEVESNDDEEEDSDKSSSSAGSVAAEWEDGSDGAEEAEAEVANRNNCMQVLRFCGVGKSLTRNQILWSG